MNRASGWRSGQRRASSRPEERGVSAWAGGSVCPHPFPAQRIPQCSHPRAQVPTGMYQAPLPVLGGSPRRRVGTAPSPLRVDRTGGPRCRGGARSHSADPRLRNPHLLGDRASSGRASPRSGLRCLRPFPLPSPSGHHGYRVPTRTTRRASAGRAGYRTHGCPHLWRPHPRHWREGTLGVQPRLPDPPGWAGRS